MRSIAIASVVLFCVTTAYQPENAKVTVDWRDLGTRVEVIGKLNVPLGTVVTVEGRYLTMDEGLKVKGNYEVSKINDATVNTTIYLTVSPIRNLTPNTRSIIQGCETGFFTRKLCGGSTMNDDDEKYDSGPFTPIFSVREVIVAEGAEKKGK